MDFGRIEFSKLDQVNFKLPKEPYSNSTVLRGFKASNAKFYVGLSKWGGKEWIGKIYPKGTREKDFLDEYVKHYNSIELNATHYKLYKPADLQKWINKVEGEDFKFSPKVYQGISHMGSLSDKQFLTDVFLKSIKIFGSHLGAVFLQISDKFSPKRSDELFDYLKSLPKDLDFYLEVRHPDWFTAPTVGDLFSFLKKMKIGLVITDAAARRDVCHMNLTVPRTLIRFIGHGNHPSDYKRLDDWVSRIKYWVDSGLEEVYFFIHCHDEKSLPQLSQYLIRELNENCDAGLNDIKLLS